MEISIKDIFTVLLKKIWIVIVCIGVGALLAFSITKIFIKPMYKSSTVFLMSYSVHDGPGGSGTANSDLNYSLNVINNCIEVIEQDDYFVIISEYLSDDRNISMTSEEIKKATKFRIKAKTTSIAVDIKTSNAELSYEIAKAIGFTVNAYIKTAYPQTGDGIIEMIKINTPTVASSPVSPNVGLITLIGAFIGMIVSFGIGTSIYMKNTHKKPTVEKSI